MLEGVEVYGGRGGGVWEGWKSMVGGAEVCERGGRVWWEGWRCVRGMECGGRGGGECGSGGSVWEGGRYMGRVVCGEGWRWVVGG